MKENLSRVRRDVNKAFEIMLGDNYINYDKIYPNTNENLSALFSHFSVKNKNVLSVLGSSDQIFNTFYNDAKSVDAFDINRLSIYYYYLRKWVIMYFGDEYIKHDYFINSSKLEELVNSIKSDNMEEQEAIMFWITYFTKFDRLSRNLFLTTTDGYDNDYKNDIYGLTKKIKNLNFYNIDFGSKFVLNKKYDVIILSNILECLHHPKLLHIARENIEKLLNKDGICVCSHVMEKQSHPLHFFETKILTSNYLVAEDFNDSYISNDSLFEREVGYVYRKK